MSQQIREPKSDMVADVSSVGLLPSNTSSNNNTDVMAKPELTSPGTRIEPELASPGARTDDKVTSDGRGRAASADEAPASVAGEVNVIEAAETKQSAAVTSDAMESTGYTLHCSTFIELLHYLTIFTIINPNS